MNEQQLDRRVIDATGWDCPAPIIATKKMLDTMNAGEVLTIVDNKIALDNLLDFAKSLGMAVSYESKDNKYHVVTKKEEGEGIIDSGNQDLVIAITSDCFGGGEEQLGKSLMKAYIFALTEADIMPKTLIFINRGIFLACEDSESLEAIEALAGKGVEVLACGACLNFYSMTEALAVGTVSNMYQIVNKMNNAGKTIKI